MSDRARGNREREVVQAFVSLTSSLVHDFDVLDLLGGLTADCVRLLDIASAGLLLADDRGLLHVVAASSVTRRTWAGHSSGSSEPTPMYSSWDRRAEMYSYRQAQRLWLEPSPRQPSMKAERSELG